MHRLFPLLCLLMVVSFATPLDAQPTRRGDTIYVADRFLGDTTVGYQLVAKFEAAATRNAELRLNRPLGVVNGKTWTLGDVIVSADFDGNGYNASWIVAGPRAVIEPYVSRMRKKMANRSLIADWLVQKLVVRCACD